MSGNIHIAPQIINHSYFVPLRFSCFLDSSRRVQRRILGQNSNFHRLVINRCRGAWRSLLLAKNEVFQDQVWISRTTVIYLPPKSDGTQYGDAGTSWRDGLRQRRPCLPNNGGLLIPVLPKLGGLGGRILFIFSHPQKTSAGGGRLINATLYRKLVRA